MSDFNSWMSNTAHAAICICSDPDSPYYGVDGAKRLARECGPALLDFPDGIKNIGSTYSGICVIAFRLKPPIGAKEWFASVREGYEKALAYKNKEGNIL